FLAGPVAILFRGENLESDRQPEQIAPLALAQVDDSLAPLAEQPHLAVLGRPENLCAVGDGVIPFYEGMVVVRGRNSPRRQSRGFGYGGRHACSVPLVG